jgi:REP element-mobilizing transposase RayT
VLAYGAEVKLIFQEIAEQSDFSFEALEVDQDHIHCLVKSKPALSPVAIVRRLKQESTKRLWDRHEAELSHQFGRSEHSGVMGTFVAPLAMPVKRPFGSILNNKAEGAIHPRS